MPYGVVLERFETALWLVHRVCVLVSLLEVFPYRNPARQMRSIVSILWWLVRRDLLGSLGLLCHSVQFSFLAPPGLIVCV